MRREGDKIFLLLDIQCLRSDKLYKNTIKQNIA